MAEIPRSIRTTEAVAAAVLTTAAGANLGLSFFVVPRLLESPTPVMVRQWRNMHAAASRVFPVAVLAPGLAHVFLAWRLPGRARLYAAAAAAFALGTVPYGFAFLTPVARKLLAKAREVESSGECNEVGIRREETAHVLVDRWATLNLVRGAAVLVAGCLGLQAALF